MAGGFSDISTFQKLSELQNGSQSLIYPLLYLVPSQEAEESRRSANVSTLTSEERQSPEDQIRLLAGCIDDK